MHCLRSNQLEKALALYRKICKPGSRNSEAWFHLGTIYGRLGKVQEAETCLRRVIALTPRYAAAHYCLGTVLREQDRLEEAVDSYNYSLQLHPGNAEAHNNLGVILHDLDRCPEAEAHYRQALQLRPDYAAAYRNLGLLLKDLEKPAEAIAAVKKALQLQPGFTDAYLSLGSLFEDLHEYNKAETAYQKAQRLNPQDTDVLCSRAWLHESQCQYQDAISLLREALAIKPDLAEANFRLALHYLRLGDFHQGWPGYEWRLKTSPHLPKGASRPSWDGGLRDFPQPLWDGSPLAERTLLVHGEQGIGDEIMFASCLPDLVSQNANIILECDPRLAPLFQRSFPDIHVHGENQRDDLSWLEQCGPVDVQLPIGSLPRHLRPGIDSFPKHSGYLLADAQARQAWRKRYRALGAGLKVGISWQAGKLAKETSRRSIPLSQWGPVLKTPGVHFINVQYGEHQQEIEAAESKYAVQIHHWPDVNPVSNLDDFAAMIAELDLVIAVDNSTVHMAGALNVPVWALLPAASNWRWMLDTDTSYWYPGVRLFRSSTDSAWLDLVTEIAAALENSALLPQ